MTLPAPAASSPAPVAPQTSTRGRPSLASGARRRRLVGAALSVGVGLGLGLGGPIARASGPEAERPAPSGPVWVRIAPSDPQLLARLRAELGLLGYEIVVDEAGSSEALGPGLLDALDRVGADAAIEIVVGPTRVELWVADGPTDTLLSRRLDLVAAPELGDPRTVAIAAVELLRASRLELGEDPQPPRPATPDPSDDPDLRPQPRGAGRLELPPTGALSLGPVVGGSPGGFGVTTHVELAGRWAPLPRFALRISAWIPTLGNSIAVTDGRVRMFVGMAFIEPQLRIPSEVRWLHPELGLGLGGAVIGFEGIADAGLRSDTRVVGGFAGQGHLGLGFTLLPRLWLRVDGYLGVVQPQPLVESTTGEVEATWGLPFASGSLGLEIWL